MTWPNRIIITKLLAASTEIADHMRVTGRADSVRMLFSSIYDESLNALRAGAMGYIKK